MPPRKVTPRAAHRKVDEDGGADAFLRQRFEEAKQKREDAKKKQFSVELQSRTSVSFGICKLQNENKFSMSNIISLTISINFIQMDPN